MMMPAIPIRIRSYLVLKTVAREQIGVAMRKSSSSIGLVDYSVFPHLPGEGL